jgi:hypothetical protein
MAHPLLSKPKADNLAAGIFLISLAAVAYLKIWWPGIFAAMGLALVVRQLFIGRFYDALISLIVFGGVFFTILYDLSWMPVLFILAGIFLLFRAFINDPPEEVDEEDEEIQKELEEKNDDTQ